MRLRRRHNSHRARGSGWVSSSLLFRTAEFRVLEDHDDGRLAPGFERHVGELHGVSPVFHSGNQMLHMKQL